MGFLLGGGAKSQATQQPMASGLKVQSSVYGKPIPIVYGTTRIAPNLIWYGDFTATPRSAPGGAGKGGVGGGGGKGGGQSGYLYSTSFEAALCEGPINGIGNVYVDKNIFSLGEQGLALFTGEPGQDPWGYLARTGPLNTEVHTVPASGPFIVTVAQAGSFAADSGITLSTHTPL